MAQKHGEYTETRKAEHLPSHVNRDVRRSPTRSRYFGWLRAFFLICVAIQCLSVLPKLFTNSSGRPIATNVPSVLARNPADEWEDDVWPIRQPTPWDISTDFPYPRNLEYDVEEGTWLRLDVHPQTGEIVFDMLGDLYCLPADSHLQTKPAQARPILLGIPHDSDPRFSPDGTKLVFRSDAELGVENIWIADWSGCDSMKLRGVGLGVDLAAALDVKSMEDDMLAAGVNETPERKRSRLVREGRLGARRVTNETYRWVSDARFHPSGDKLIATKWYTSSRSLGAGEGWEYSLPSGNESIAVGSGRRLVGRSLPRGWAAGQYGDQQIGPEQLIWRGEDCVIYSQNVADRSGVFTYSKDVHAGIYAIFSRNLTTNRTETLVEAFPGGASRPELSRDGRTLAFVRRVRDKEALVLKDLQTGTLHHAWHGLTYDLGTVSAPMGTYPSFAFSPHDETIVIWAAGQIWRVPLAANAHGERVAAGAPSTIPFRARVEKRIAATRRGGADIVRLETADTQRLHAFKELSVDEDGSTVVFQGAGATYVQATGPAAARARRVPVLHPGLAYYSPSFVPGNSSLVVHARWSDTHFTAFELADVAAGAAYDLSGDLPLGRYRSPVVCACTGRNRRLAFVKTGGDLLTGDVVATAGEGLYVGDIVLPDPTVPDSAAKNIVIRNLRYIPSEIDVSDHLAMRFIERSAKLLVQQSRRAFVIDLARGPDELGDYNHTTLAEGRMSQEIATSVSVNEKASSVEVDNVAIVDFFNVYIARANGTGAEPIWSKPGRAPQGLARTSLDGGHDIRWSSDGQKLFWFLGPYLHSLNVSQLSECKSEIANDTTTFGISCVKGLLDIEEVHVSYRTDVWRLKQDATEAAITAGRGVENSDLLVIVNATLITMETGSLREDLITDAVVVIRGGVIERAGAARNVQVPQGVLIVNARKGFVVPGFIDVHAHWGGMDAIHPARSWELETFLAYGVTTLHNPSSDNVDGSVERARVENGGMIGPRIFHTGNVIYGAGAPGIHQDVADLADARSALIRIKVEGGPATISYKNYNQYSRASRQRLLLAARNLSMSCVPEGGMNQDWDLTYIVDGMTTIEHALPVPTLYDDVLKLYTISGTGATPTHIVNYGGAWGEQLVWAHEDVPNDPKLRRFTRHDILEGLTESTARPKNSYALFNTSASVAKMVKQGLRAHIGAHGEPPLGVNYHAEMFFTQQGGLDNYEVLRAATIDAAVTLGIDGSLGSISSGKLADFVIYPPEVDILAGDIRASRNIKYVARGGRIWDAATMVEEWPKQGRRRRIPPINAE